MTKQRTRLKKLKITELSSVDRGANQYADVVLMKRDTSDTDAVDAIVKMSLAYAENNKPSTDFRASLKDELERRNMHEVWEKTWPLMDALRESVHAAATQMSGDAKVKQIELNVASFKEKLLAVINQQETTAMTPEELAKKLEELEGLTKSLEAERDEALAKAGMTDAEKAYMNGMDEKKRPAFMAMTPEERKRMMEEKPMAKADENKDEVTKRLEAIEKAHLEELEKRDKELATLNKRLEMAELTKRADAEYSNLPGESIKKALVLSEIEKMSDESKEFVLSMLKAHDAKLAEATKEIGKSGESTGNTATEKLENLAKKWAEDKGIDYHTAYDQVTRTAEGARLYAESAQ